MRIVLVNWARIWDGATLGGGVNGYCQALALELARRGHDVISLCGGNAYTAVDPRACRVEIRRHADWMGLRVFEVVNSPVLAPSICQFGDPLAEASSPELERVVAAFFSRIKPEVVHFHNIEGFSAGCVASAKAAGAGVVFSLHNYHTICPQVYLMRGHRRACYSYDDGHACEGCIESPSLDQTRRDRVELTLRGDAPAAASRADALVRQAPPRGRWSLGTLLDSLSTPSSRPTPAALGSPTDADADLTRPIPPPNADERGKTRYLHGELTPRVWPGPHDPEWQPLDNDPVGEPLSTAAPGPYAQRRSAMLAMLASCDRVLAVSEFVRRKFAAMGVPERVLRTVPIGTRIGEVADRHKELVFAPPPIDPASPRPLRLLFIGYNHWYKGLPMLADSLELLTPDYLSRIHLFVYALGGESIEWRFRRLEPRLAALTIHHGYEYHDIPWMCGGKDYGLVPSVWWDNAPQTVFEYLGCGLPVIGANLGGIPDFVHDGVNGLLFRGNDRYALAQTLARTIREPGLAVKLRDGVRPPRSVGDHALEMEQIYHGCVPSRSGEALSGGQTGSRSRS